VHVKIQQRERHLRELTSNGRSSYLGLHMREDDLFDGKTGNFSGISQARPSTKTLPS
jgi:hypothetical protein